MGGKPRARKVWRKVYEGCYQAYIEGLKVRVSDGSLGWILTVHNSEGGSTSEFGYSSSRDAKNAAPAMVRKELARLARKDG